MCRGGTPGGAPEVRGCRGLWGGTFPCLHPPTQFCLWKRFPSHSPFQLRVGAAQTDRLPGIPSGLQRQHVPGEPPWLPASCAASCLCQGGSAAAPGLCKRRCPRQWLRWLEIRRAGGHGTGLLPPQGQPRVPAPGGACGHWLRVLLFLLLVHSWRRDHRVLTGGLLTRFSRAVLLAVQHPGTPAVTPGLCWAFSTTRPSAGSGAMAQQGAHRAQFCPARSSGAAASFEKPRCKSLCSYQEMRFPSCSCRKGGKRARGAFAGEVGFAVMPHPAARAADSRFPSCNAFP